MKLDIDWLRENHLQKPYFFGLGFIQLKIDLHRRLHFYTNKYRPIVEDSVIHNHRYDFIAHVLKGFISNNIYTIKDTNASRFVREYVSCESGKEAPKICVPTELVTRKSLIIKSGESYTMTHNQYHKVSTTQPTITYLLRGQKVKEYASIVRNTIEGNICPFSFEVSEKECWEIIEEMLK